MPAGFYAIYLRVASPEVFGFGTLSLALSMVLIGGTGTIIGPIAAALILTFGTEAMASIRGMEEARFIVVAVLMIVVLRFSPGGLARIGLSGKAPASGAATTPRSVKDSRT